MTTGAADHHFEDRSHLLAALAEAGFVELSAKLAAGAETGGKVPGRAIRSMVLAYVNFARANPVRYGLMYLPEIEDRSVIAEGVTAPGSTNVDADSRFHVPSVYDGHGRIPAALLSMLSKSLRCSAARPHTSTTSASAASCHTTETRRTRSGPTADCQGRRCT